VAGTRTSMRAGARASAPGTRMCADQEMKSMGSNSEQNLKFPENMMEVTRFESTLHEHNLIPLAEALMTCIKQNADRRSKHKAKNEHRNRTDDRQPANMPSVSEYASILHAFSFKILVKAH
jgi:hypothetical protein